MSCWFWQNTGIVYICVDYFEIIEGRWVIVPHPKLHKLTEAKSTFRKVLDDQKESIAQSAQIWQAEKENLGFNIADYTKY